MVTIPEHVDPLDLIAAEPEYSAHDLADAGERAQLMADAIAEANAAELDEPRRDPGYPLVAHTYTLAELAELPRGAALLNPANGSIYRRCTDVDVWPGTSYARAVAAAFREHGERGLGWGSSGTVTAEALADLTTFPLVLVWQPRS